jgi:ribosomal-protein-alanine N-acetyltransferase
MKLTLRYMDFPDIPQVITIDRLSFDLPWAERSYAYEIAESGYSHMVVLERGEDESPQLRGWRRWMPRLNGRDLQTERIAGYGGLWSIGSEAHISTIAVHPDYRGRGWGEILLAGMVGKSIHIGAHLVVLEVRVSNTRAQNLYHKYEFENVGVKPRYYRNNNEDAYDMRLHLDRPGAISRYNERLNALKAAHDYIDQYSNGQSPYKPTRETP